MQECVEWLNHYAGAVQAMSAVVLLFVTSWYAFRAHQLTSLTKKQLDLVEKAQRPQLKVVLQTAYLSMNDGSLVPALSLAGSNTGMLPVNIDAPFIQFPDKRTMAFLGGFLHSDSGYPQKLEPGDGCTVYINAQDILSILEKENVQKMHIYGALRDKPGNIYLSDAYEFEADVWLRCLQEK